jgi:hypothetical protein
MSEKVHEYKYVFKFKDGQEKTFLVKLDAETLDLIRENPEPPPSWCELEQFKCPHCPLDTSLHQYCPVALTLFDLVPHFQDLYSYEEANVIVHAPRRGYFKKTSLQSSVSSLLGIYMSSSGCPYLKKLRPMLHFHLPFASLDETEVRAFSIFLLAQFVKWKQGGEPDWNLDNLAKIYDDIGKLNRSVSKKIQTLETKDTSINSLVVLNTFADHVGFTLGEQDLEELEFFVKEFM